MAMAVGKGEGQSFTDINMTPLIDVMLVFADHFHHLAAAP